MAHEIEANYAVYAVNPAWHGLGTVLPHAPSVEEALKLSGLDRKVGLQPMFLANGMPVGSNFAVVRECDGAQFGVVGADYTVVQDADGFKWIQPIIDSGEATIEAAGSLRGGSRSWILAKLRDGRVEVTPGDAIEQYVLFAHSHDGTLALRAGFTATRVVCQNTLSMAISADSKRMLKFKHTQNVHANLEAAKEVFDMKRAELKASAHVFKMMATKKLSDKLLVTYIRETLKEGAGADESIKVRNVDEIVRLAHEAPGAVPGTLWGGYNAITNYNTHHRGRSADNRVNSNWFGTGGQMTQRALDVAVQFAEELPTNEIAYQASQSTALASYAFNEIVSKPASVQEDEPSDFGSLLSKPVRAEFDCVAAE